ncbi:GIP [Symbiodinium sp. CCMP2456]|nr:GIP [Symbiodinium sp. CCMP2456]
MAAASVTRGRDGIPAWDGTPSSFEEYAEQCLNYEQSTPTYKRYLVGPKLVGELTGAAKRHIAGQPTTWLSHDQGVDTLLRHLRACLGRPQIPEMTEYLNRYFRQGRRKPQESMNEYISRKCEVYLRACQAMQRVAPYHQDKSKEHHNQWSPGDSYDHGQGRWYGTRTWTNDSRRSSWDSNSTSRENHAPATTQAAAPTTTGTAGNGDEGASEQSDGSQRTDADAWSHQSWWGGSTWQPWGYGYGSYYGWESAGSNQTRPSTRGRPLPELLPEFIQGWYLLQDAGLTQSERNLVQTAVQNDFSLQRVAQELRTQFHDVEHQRREHRPHSYLGTIAEDEDLDEEELILWSEAAEEIQQACAVIQNARRTLKEARAKQSAVRLARKYYKPGNFNKPKDDSQMICLKRGVKGHRAANCTGSGEHELLSTKEAVKAGYAVIDGGATRTLGSVAAIQNVMDINARKYGDSRVLAVDLANTPVFGFGNSTEDRCTSTIDLGISAGNREGQISIHALDKGESPILLSVASLRSLGAIIDFEADLVRFRAVDPRRVLAVQRSITGHQLLPLTEDLYASARFDFSGSPHNECVNKFLPQPALALHSMDIQKLKKAELQATLRELGEEPPTRWTKKELTQRILEIKPSLAEKPTKQVTDLQAKIKALGVAARKKSTLTAFCEEVGVDMRSNHNMWSMEQAALRRLYDISTPAAEDVVGFGQHSTLLYRDILILHPSYKDWAIRAAKTATADYRLVRLATWLEQQSSEDIELYQTKSEIMDKKSKDIKATPSKASSSSEVPVEQLKNMMETMHNLQQEVAEMRAEKPRKEVRGKATDPAMTETNGEGPKKM